MKNLTIENIVKACKGEYFGTADLTKEITGVTTDSRKLEEGNLYAAFAGERVDGHKFIEDCLNKGALVAIGEQEVQEGWNSYIRVKSTEAALRDIAAFYRAQLSCKVVGITGSVGKTSTKETVASVLGEKYRVVKTQGNFNNQIGLPLTVFSLDETTEVAVLEMGIGDFGDMSNLTAVAKPDVAIITNIGVAHMENLKSRDGILKAKTEIFEGMDENGTVILNGDDDKLVLVQESHGKRPLFFGIDNKSGVYAEDIEDLGLEGTRCVIRGLDTADHQESISVTIPVAGRHMVLNAMAAALVGEVLGLTAEEIRTGIEKMQTIAGRNNKIVANGLTVLDDCYNASPTSMKASIDIINSAEGRKVCILGDMFELGKNESSMHYDVGMYLGGKQIDVLITAGKLAENIAQGAKAFHEAHYEAYDTEVHAFATKEEMLEHLDELILKGDTVLVKASHGMGFAEVVEKLTHEE